MNDVSVDFDNKVRQMSRTDLIELALRMGQHLDSDLEESARFDNEGCILPQKDQDWDFVRDMMDILDYE